MEFPGFSAPVDEFLGLNRLFSGFERNAPPFSVRSSIVSVATLSPITPAPISGSAFSAGRCILPGRTSFLEFKSNGTPPPILFRTRTASVFLLGSWETGKWFHFDVFSRLEPLLGRIKEKRSAILCPGIDMISEQNMGYGVSPPIAVRDRFSQRFASGYG